MLVLAACGSKVKPAHTDKPLFEDLSAPTVVFDPDSAYAYVKAQVEMGPRVPGTKAHDACADYLVGKLRDFGADTVITQEGVVTAFDGTRLPIRNIVARFRGVNPRGKRIVLMAHYDTRPWADEDADEANRLTPIDGANDGASGVGVLLEVARHLGKAHPGIDVDIFLTDAEDYGASGGENEDSWCLGTQYYLSSNPYAAERDTYGILLDMVGGKDAKFYREYFSEAYAKPVNDRVWAEAKKIGLTSRFVDRLGGAITDDHLYFNRAGITTVDIIEMQHPTTGSFPPYWHTLGDNIDNIDPSTLGAVGQVVTNVVYHE